MTEFLQTHYSREIFRALTEIKTKLKELYDTPSDITLVKQIYKLIESTADLAMIHGYEGVEKIAGKLVALITPFNSDKRIENYFFRKMDAAIEAIYKVAELEANAESQMKIEYINRDVEASAKIIKQRTNELIDKFTVLETKQLELGFDEKINIISEIKSGNKRDEHDELVFEIKEYDAILKLPDKFQNYTIDLFEPV